MGPSPHLGRGEQLQHDRRVSAGIGHAGQPFQARRNSGNVLRADPQGETLPEQARGSCDVASAHAGILL
jgi:hypothetical protein